MKKLITLLILFMAGFMVQAAIPKENIKLSMSETVTDIDNIVDGIKINTMKIFKNLTMSEIKHSDETKIKIGETYVCRSSTDRHEFEIYYQRLAGVYTPMGKFKELKQAISLAQKIEKPDMINSGYQIVKLSHNQNLVIYYDQMDVDVLHYIEDSDQISSPSFQIGESGISLRFITKRQTNIEALNEHLYKEDMLSFGKYLLSDERREKFKSHPVFGSERLEQRLSEVHHTDVTNWLERKNES